MHTANRWADAFLQKLEAAFPEQLHMYSARLDRVKRSMEEGTVEHCPSILALVTMGSTEPWYLRSMSDEPKRDWNDSCTPCFAYNCPLQLPPAPTPLNAHLPPGPAISIAMMASSSKGVVPLHYLVWQVS